MSPEGGDGGAGCRFALLAHAHPLPGWPAVHFDLLLEDPSLPGERRCRTWRLRADPRVAAAGTPGAVAGEPIAPHRAYYLDYQGPVTGGRGTVARLDGGPLRWVTRTPAVVELAGDRLRGRWRADAAGFGLDGP